MGGWFLRADIRTRVTFAVMEAVLEIDGEVEFGIAEEDG